MHSYLCSLMVPGPGPEPLLFFAMQHKASYYLIMVVQGWASFFHVQDDPFELMPVERMLQKGLT